MPNQPEQTSSVVPSNQQQQQQDLPSNGCHAPIPAGNNHDNSMPPSNGSDGKVGYQGQPGSSGGCQATPAGDMTTHMTSQQATSPASKELEIQIGSTRSIWETPSQTVAKQPSQTEGKNPASGGGKFCFGGFSGYYLLNVETKKVENYLQHGI